MNEREIFMAVLDLPDETARAAYLDQVCGADSEKRARIDALLASHESAASFLGTPAVEPVECGLTQEVTSDGTSGSENQADDVLKVLQPSSRLDSLGRIGHYEVLQVLGRGAFGIVFRAFDDVLQRVVAIKVLAPAIAATSPARKRFLREARSSAQARHETVVPTYAVEEQPLPYLVMEFIPGETLQQRLDRTGPLDPAETVRLGRQIAEGLAAAHATGLIHRDIKPGNVLIENGPYERVKITDFGLARAADDASVTQSGVLAGTPMYMAPEQARGESLDHRADLFSLGSVLYVMVTGRPPFRAPSTYAVLKRVADDHPRPIKEVIPEVPTWLCDIISTLHAKNADDRFQNAREVADMLTDCEKQLNASGKVKIKVRRSTRPNVIPLTPVSQPAPKRASRWKWAAAIFLASALVTYGVFSLIQPGAQSAADGSENNNPGIDPTLVVAEDTKVHATDYDWIEVIPLIDPKLDKWDLPSTGKNEWRVENGELAGGYADAKPHKLLFPLDSDWAAFECEFEFTRRSGESGFNLCIPAKTGDCPVVFDYSGNWSVTLGKRGKAAAFSGKHQIQNGRRTAARVAILK